jgi:Protein of unknown function (DUF2786)
MAGRDQSEALRTIRGLLAKAESTAFEAEAEAFTAKAQELMAAYSIEMAMLEGRAEAAGGSEPQSRRIVIARPYSEPKVQLLGVAADANHCGVIWDRDDVAVVFGFEHDLAAVELLFTSLLVQATRAMTARGSQVDWSGRNRTRSFRRSFLMGFASRIGWRLRQATAEAAVAAEASFGSALVPLLAERKQRVVAAMDRAFPYAAKMRTSTSNLSGWFAGEEAADRADLGNRSSIAS